MANESSPNSNGSQFFFTLDKCDWLDKKHTIFGKVTGDSIYNLLRLGEVDTGKDDRPLDPAPKILSVEVLWNPFEDIVPRVLAKTLQESVAEIKEPQKKPMKKLNLLSFGEEAEEEEKELAVVKQKIKSSHDVLNDPKVLLTESSSQKGREESTLRSDAVSSEDEKPRMEKLSLKKKGIGSETKAELMEKGDIDLQLYNASERARQLHKLKKRRLQGNEDAVLAKLEKFKQSISAKPSTSSSEPVDNKEDLSGWKKVKLKFAPERGEDKMSRKDDPDMYVVVDPLLEKGKEKFNRMQAKQKRKEREWSGKSLA